MSIYSRETLIAFYIPLWKRVLLWFLPWRWQIADDRTVIFGYKVWRGTYYFLRAEPVPEWRR